MPNAPAPVGPEYHFQSFGDFDVLTIQDIGGRNIPIPEAVGGLKSMHEITALIGPEVHFNEVSDVESPPYDGIFRIHTGGQVGTAFRIGPQFFITAAHGVFKNEWLPAPRLQRFDQAGNLVGEWSVQKAFVPRQFVHESNVRGYDLAVLVVCEPPPTSSVFCLSHLHRVNHVNGMTLRAAGFPVLRPAHNMDENDVLISTTGRQMFETEGEMGIWFGGFQVGTNMDVLQGHSGCPFYVEQAGLDQPLAIGVAEKEPNQQGTTLNWGSAFTRDILLAIARLCNQWQTEALQENNQ